MTHADELKSGERFEFGENWRRFLMVLDDERIESAKQSLQKMLDIDFQGKTLIDVGSGSGLSSLVARKLGAKVRSFDYDPKSVACTRELRRRYFPEDPNWDVEEGSALDPSYVKSLGTYDIVYSWGVLHHTGQMKLGLENVISLVKPGGVLFIAIYNDQGGTSRRWLAVKRLYCSGIVGRIITRAIFYPYFAGGRFVADVLNRRNPFTSYARYKSSRGMSVVHDWEDWLGGYPFEVAKPEEIYELYQSHGFTLKKLKTCGGGLGCNEFIFYRN